MRASPALLGSLFLGLFAACSGAQPPRPNLPPPEYEEPSIREGTTTPAADASTAPAIPGPTSPASP